MANSEHEISFRRMPNGFWVWSCSCRVVQFATFFKKVNAEKYAERHLAEVEATDGD